MQLSFALCQPTLLLHTHAKVVCLQSLLLLFPCRSGPDIPPGDVQATAAIGTLGYNSSRLVADLSAHLDRLDEQQEAVNTYQATVTEAAEAEQARVQADTHLQDWDREHGEELNKALEAVNAPSPSKSKAGSTSQPARKKSRVSSARSVSGSAG